MAEFGVRRSALTLYTSAASEDIYGHCCRLVLKEKHIQSVDIHPLDPSNLPREFLELNPYFSLPTLVERDFVLYQPHIIMEYLEERYPYPALLPTHPMEKARCRLMLYRIDKDWFSIYEHLREAAISHRKNIDDMMERLKEGVLTLSPILKKSTYFLGENFSLVDCYLAVLLWRLSAVGIELVGNQAKILKEYAERLFAREAFQESILA